ncbi:MAG: guanylate kinase [Planctomycetes bacterium]|nr:guanylate kinase [Planctomycetota bacterium]
MADSGKMVIISGPSGAGKSTLVRELLRTSSLPLELSVSATTRSPRHGEIDGVNYFFLDHAEFDRRRREGDFLEWKEVFGRGDFYGTPRAAVYSGLRQGKWVVLEIDVEGAMAVIGEFPESISIFIHPGTAEELERRLRGRGTEDESSLQRRLQVAAREMTFVGKYRHQVINDDAARAIQELDRILRVYQ